MPSDRHLRTSERGLSEAPGDAPGWLRLARDYERLGRRDEAVGAAFAAFRLAPGDPDVRGRLAALGLGDGPWALPKGNPEGQQRSPLPGPDVGVLRWRARLPRRAAPRRPLIDLDGAAWVTGESAGVTRVDAGGRVAADDPDWPGDVAPILADGAARALDPALLALRARPRGPLWAAARDAAGWTFGLGPQAVVAVDPDGDVAWRLDVPSPVELAAAPGEGPLYLALADPRILDAEFDRPGRVLALERAGGAVAWELDAGRSLCGDGQLAVAVAPDGALVAQVGMDLVCCEADGPIRWRRKVEWGAAPALWEDLVVTVTPADGARAFDLGTGAPRWARPELKANQAPAVDARGRAYLATLDGRLAAVDPTGRLVFRLNPGAAGHLGPPALGIDGTAYVVARRELLAVR